jgi:hypothetical protein
MVPGVFLSHSSKDKPFVLRLAADLFSHGVSVWLDSWEMDAGDQFDRQIADGIDQSTFLIVALFPNSVLSGWVNRELDTAPAKET